MKVLPLYIFAPILTVALLIPPLSAQQLNMGAINGTVTDASGGAIPGVKVTATSPALQAGQVYTTNEQGIYRFPSLPIGLYKLTYEASGFGTVVRDQVNVRLSFVDTINITMVPATQQQTVVVTAESPLVDTQNTQIIGGFNLQQLNEIPNGRDMWSAIGLTPGMHDATLDVGGSQVGNQVAYQAYGYGGQNRVMIDGVNDSEGTAGAGFYFDYGAFQEFTVGTQGNNASMPVPGNQVNAVIKTGTNQFHGECTSIMRIQISRVTTLASNKFLKVPGLASGFTRTTIRMGTSADRLLKTSSGFIFRFAIRRWPRRY